MDWSARQPAFAITNIDAPTWRAYLLTPFVAALAGVGGSFFPESHRWICANNKFGPAKFPAGLNPPIGATLAWGIGAAVFFLTGRLGVFGLGYGDLTAGTG